MSSRKNNKKGRDFERSTKKRYGGKMIPGSGSGLLKEDTEDGDWLIQNKSTAAKSFRVTFEDMEKVRVEAALRGKIPRMDIQIMDATPVPPVYVVLPRNIFESMVREGNNGTEA